MIQILRSMKLLQAPRISFPPSLIAFPELLAPMLLQWCYTSGTFTFSFAVLHDYLAIVTSNMSLLSQHNASRHSTPQSPQVASMVVREHGAQIFRRIQEQDGSNVDNQFAHENALPKAHGLQLEAIRALINSKGSFRHVGHLRADGCKRRAAIAKEIIL